MVSSFVLTSQVFLKFFSFFGLVQISVDETETIFRLFWTRAVVIFCLFLYWASFVPIIWLENQMTDKISQVSNKMQAILNMIMFTVVLAIPVFYQKRAIRIVENIHKLHQQLALLEISINNLKIIKSFAFAMLFLMFFIFYWISYDAYVHLILYNSQSVYYWLLTLIPLIVLVLILVQAICVLIYVRILFKKVNKTLIAETRSEVHVLKELGEKALLEFGTTIVNFPDHIKTPTFPTIFHSIGHLNEICEVVETYFGPIFLASFTTIFVVTAVQLYYTYRNMLYILDDDTKSIWSLFSSINSVVTNSFLVVTITAVCQSITNQSKKAIRSIYKLQTVGSLNCSAMDIQNMVRGIQCYNKEIRFSAMNFFPMDYSMLCGMIGAIATYLLIYIQFSDFNSGYRPDMLVRSTNKRFD